MFFPGIHAENFGHGLRDTTEEFAEVKRTIIQSCEMKFRVAAGKRESGHTLAEGRTLTTSFYCNKLAF
jgi:hypothetical protein